MECTNWRHVSVSLRPVDGLEKASGWIVSDGLLGIRNVLTIDGGTRWSGVDLYFHEMTFDSYTCELYPEGTLSVRDDDGYWYDMTFECGNCARLMWGDQDLGEVCPGEDARGSGRSRHGPHGWNGRRTMSGRPIIQRVQGRPTSDGAGVRLTRILGIPPLTHLDPFLMLDEFGSEDGADYIRWLSRPPPPWF